MPRKDVWIKKVDLPAWEALGNKSEWVHIHLNLKKRKIYTAPRGMSETGMDEAAVTIPKPDEWIQKNPKWSGPMYRNKKKEKL